MDGNKPKRRTNYLSVFADFGPLFRQGYSEEQRAGYRFISLGSGSNGNCSLLSHQESAIMLDAGLGIRLFHRHIREQKLDISKVKAIFITHDHADHTRGVAKLAHRFQLPIYASPDVARSLLYHRHASAELSAYIKVMHVGDQVEIGGMRIRSFEVPHDATQNVGYTVESNAGRFVLITDIGKVTPKVIEEIRAANYLIFESNYDEEMLRHGPYPLHLKRRIIGGEGHISNREAAETIAEHIHPELKFLALCHLSEQNNSPEVAIQTMKEALNNRGIEWERHTELRVLKRGECSPFFNLK